MPVYVLSVLIVQNSDYNFVLTDDKLNYIKFHWVETVLLVTWKWDILSKPGTLSGENWGRVS